MSNPGLSAGTAAAIPFLVLSGVMMTRWIGGNPDALPLFGDVERMIKVEGVVLFYGCFMLSGALMMPDREQRYFAAGMMFLVALALSAFWWGTETEGAYLFCSFWGLVLSHLAGRIGAPPEESGRQASVVGMAILAYVLVGMSATSIESGKFILNFLEPDLWNTQVDERELLAWGGIYFGAVGVLHWHSSRWDVPGKGAGDTK